MNASPVPGCLLALALSVLPACAPPPPAPEAPRAPAIVSAGACAAPPTSEDVAAAKGAHATATRFFERGDYDAAIRYWTYAYEFDCTAHRLLLNIAKAMEKQGDGASSLAQIEAYLKHQRKTPLVEERQRRLRAGLASKGR